MEPLSLDELKSEKCPRISAEDLLELGDYLGNGVQRSPTRTTTNVKPMLLVIDVRSPDEYPFSHVIYMSPFISEQEIKLCRYKVSVKLIDMYM